MLSACAYAQADACHCKPIPKLRQMDFKTAKFLKREGFIQILPLNIAPVESRPNFP
jgi:hypothetical protein